MRRLAIGLFVLLVAAVLVGDLVLTRMVNRDPLRSRIEGMVDEAVGRDVTWDELGVGLVPPSLVISHPRIASDEAGAPAFAEARKVSLRVALLPLLARTFVIDSLRLDEAVVRLVRTRDGLSLPDFGRGREREEPTGGSGGSGEETALAVHSAELSHARIVFEDRTFDEPRRLELTDVDARLEGSGPKQPVDVRLDVTGEGGGRLELEGSALLDGDVDLAITLKDFKLLPLNPYLAAASELSGLVTGTFRVAGPLEAPTSVVGDVTITETRLAFAEFEIDGPVVAHIEHAGPWEAPTGSFRLDVTGARANLGGVYEKVPGRPGTVTGKLRTVDGVPQVYDARLTIEKLEASGSASLGKRLHLAVDVGPVDLAYWQPLLKPVADYPASGRLAAGHWEVWTDPFDLRGALQASDVRFQMSNGRTLEVEGAAEARDGRIVTRDLVVTADEQRVPVEAEITDLGGAWRYRVRTDVSEADSARLVALFGDDGALSGPLDFDGDLTGTLTGETSFADALGGTARFRISPGKLEGISILEATLRAFDEARSGTIFQGLMARTGGLAPQFEEFYQDDFLLLSADVKLAGGIASTQDLELRTADYTFTMQGGIRLADLGLDARGEILLGDELAGALGKRLGLGEVPLLRGIAIPIPRLRGTVTDPKPEPDFTFLIRALTGNLPGARATEKLLKGVEELLKKP